MRKSNFVHKLYMNAELILAIIAILLLTPTLILLVNAIVGGFSSYRTFLSNSSEMFCCIVLCFGGIALGVLTLVVVCQPWENREDDTADNNESLADAIASNHGNDLATVMDAIRNESLEYRAFFDSDGHKLTEGTLQSPEKCNIPAKDWDRVYQFACTDLHNHPGTDEVSFSDKDLANLVRLGIQRSIVVTHSFNYIMENPWHAHRDDSPDAESVGQYVRGLWSKHWFARILFRRTCSRYVSRCVAKKFGLRYRIEHVRLQRLKNCLQQAFTMPRRIVATSIMIGSIALISLSVNPDTEVYTNDNVMTDADTRDLAVTNQDIDWDYYESIKECEWAEEYNAYPISDDPVCNGHIDDSDPAI